MRQRLAATALMLACAAAALGRPSPPRPEHDVIEQEVVYRVPGMDKVKVRTGIPYKKTDGGTLTLDLYSPPDAPGGANLPAVVFINGVGDRPASKLKDWGIYRSWGRLVAASGWIGVTFEATGAHTETGGHIRDLFAFLRSDGARLGIDPDRIAAWVCSGNVTSGLPVLMEGVDAGVLGAVVYYGSADPAKLRNDLPIFYVRAGRDNPGLNARIDALWTKAIAAGAPWAMVNAPQSHHAFDALDETDESRRIVRGTLDFYRDLFTPPVAPGPPSAAKKALAHWFGGREYPEAAKAYAAYVKSHPDDAIAWMRLGVSQATTGDPAATASLEKAVALGADTPTDLYNVACGYALLGRKDAAIGWLERAVAAGFTDGRLLRTDSDLESLRGDPRFEALAKTLGT
jgi:tetratricopeptide (TPR) repeat protein